MSREVGLGGLLGGGVPGALRLPGVEAALFVVFDEAAPLDLGAGADSGLEAYPLRLGAALGRVEELVPVLRACRLVLKALGQAVYFSGHRALIDGLDRAHGKIRN